MDARAVSAACLVLGAAAGAAATYALLRPRLARLVSERDALRAAGRERDAAAMDQVSQLLQRGARATARAKLLVASKSRAEFETEEQRMRRTMPKLSPRKRGRPTKGGGSVVLGPPRPSTVPNTLCLFVNRACPFSHRAFIVALEKRLDRSAAAFQTVHIDTDPDAQPVWWEQISPSGNLPALQHVGSGGGVGGGVSNTSSRSGGGGGGGGGAFVLAGSVECCEWLDQSVPSPVDPLLPAADELALEIGSVVQLFGRRFVGPGFRLLTNPHPLRDQDLGRAFEAACTWWDRLLGSKNVGKGGAFYFGARFSMVEAMTFPFVDRFAAVLPEYRGFSVDQKSAGGGRMGSGTKTQQHRWPALVAWVAACKHRPSVARSRGSDEFYIESYRDAAGARARAWDQEVRGSLGFVEQDGDGRAS
jgi:glutathione S-transferase